MDEWRVFKLKECKKQISSAENRQTLRVLLGLDEVTDRGDSEESTHTHPFDASDARQQKTHRDEREPRDDSVFKFDRCSNAEDVHQYRREIGEHGEFLKLTRDG